ncbi:acetyl-CoA carboxylase carboxyltransferase subunit beta [Vibrio metschnikovii]
MTARQRLDHFLDSEDRIEIGSEYEPKDVLNFKDLQRYKTRLALAQKNAGEKRCTGGNERETNGFTYCCLVPSNSLLWLAQWALWWSTFRCWAVDTAIDNQCGLVCFSACGGARMQESLTALMQMAKTSAALRQLAMAKLPYISVLTDQTYGGVSASLAMLGDINIGEPKARIGFAGRRVIEQTVREKLPENFQQSEFLLAHGALDMIVDRRDMRQRVGSLIAKMTKTTIAVDQ